jgi:ketosteroid isomerase-like protein
MRLLAADAVILESGGRESRDEYAAHHLPEDIAFSRAVPSQPGPLHVTVSGDVAWASSTSVLQGTYRNQKIDMVGAELMVLGRVAAGWEIRAIHWSSRTR